MDSGDGLWTIGAITGCIYGPETYISEIRECIVILSNDRDKKITITDGCAIAAFRSANEKCRACLNRESCLDILEGTFNPYVGISERVALKRACVPMPHRIIGGI